MTIDFDLDVLDELQQSQEEGVVVTVLKPGTQETLLTIRVAGPDSAQQKRANVRATEEHAARGANTPLTPDENKVAGDRYLARCCMDWSVKGKDGRDIPFSEDAAYEMMKRYPLIRQEVDNAAANRLRFIKRSQTA